MAIGTWKNTRPYGIILNDFELQALDSANINTFGDHRRLSQQRIYHTKH
ncbi:MULTISPECIES: hypothetical protein [Chryseobacterium]|nr:hypothetical protein [Chryseobacterium oleae]